MPELVFVVMAVAAGFITGMNLRQQLVWQRLTRLRFRHVKRGSTYVKVGVGRAQCANLIRDMDTLVAYRDEKTGDWWFRPPAEFNDPERFERLGDVS